MCVCPCVNIYARVYRMCTRVCYCRRLTITDSRRGRNNRPAKPRCAYYYYYLRAECDGRRDIITADARQRHASRGYFSPERFGPAPTILRRDNCKKKKNFEKKTTTTTVWPSVLRIAIPTISSETIRPFFFRCFSFRKHRPKFFACHTFSDFFRCLGTLSTNVYAYVLSTIF